MKINLFMIKSIMITRINLIIKFKIIKNKKFIKRSLLNKILMMIMKKINFIMKFMLISLIFISFIAIALRFSTRNQNFINT